MFWTLNAQRLHLNYWISDHILISGPLVKIVTTPHAHDCANKWSQYLPQKYHGLPCDIKRGWGNYTHRKLRFSHRVDPPRGACSYGGTNSELLRQQKGDWEKESSSLEMLHEVLSTVGFVYLSNHGISEELVGGASMKAGRREIVCLCVWLWLIINVLFSHKIFKCFRVFSVAIGD